MDLPLHFASPYWLLGLILVFCVFYFRTSSWYIAKTYTVKEGQSWNARMRHGIPSFLFFFAAFSMVLALADITRTYTVVLDKKTVNRILVTVDNSSSMYNFNSEVKSIYCTDELKL